MQKGQSRTFITLSEAGTERGRSLPKGFAHIQGRQTLLASSHPNPRKDTNHKSNGLSPFPEEKSLSSPNMGPPLSAPTSPAFCVQSALAPPLLVQWRIYAAPELHTHTHKKRQRKLGSAFTKPLRERRKCEKALKSCCFFAGRKKEMKNVTAFSAYRASSPQADTILTETNTT